MAKRQGKALFKKPVGETKMGIGFKGYWNNRELGTDGPVCCEICGTIHPKNEIETYVISNFLGLQVVESCCGAVLDRVYRESGDEFCQAYLEEFAENPTDFRYSLLLDKIIECLKKAKEKTDEMGEKIEKALGVAQAI